MVEYLAFNDQLILFGKIILAFVLGLSLGFERTIAGRVAGMRTYALVSMAACLLAIMADVVARHFSTFIADANPFPYLAGIVTGVGFICAGMIIFNDNKLTGLTTAAGMWVATAVGMAVGFGLSNVAIFVSIITLVTFSFLWKLEEMIKQASREARD